MIGPKELDKLFIDGKYEEYLNSQTRQVRWLFNNSNKTLQVISQKDVHAVVFKMRQEIEELKNEIELHKVKI